MEDGPVLRRRFLVVGQVQGVGFRAWTVRNASELRLNGVVRNLDDGSVEVEVVGAAASVNTLHEQLKEGPRFARVADVKLLPPSARELPIGCRVEW